MSRAIQAAFIFIILSQNVWAQDTCKLVLAKKRNLIGKHNILEENIGKPFTYFGRLYFRTTEDPVFRKVGRKGKNLNLYFDDSLDAGFESFQNYIKYKRQSRVLFISSFLSAYAWGFSSAVLYNYRINTGAQNQDVATALLNPITLPFLAGNIYFFRKAQQKNIKGDLMLLDAINQHNIEVSKPIHSIE
jgi:hypothetical protein